MPNLPISIPHEAIESFCAQNRIRKLSLFGSVLTDRFHAASDVDVLVEFESDARPTLLTLARLERELSAMIGRKVDLRMPGDLSRYFRDEVLASSSPQYERI
jgi:predicted nucleotidyltransferase